MLLGFSLIILGGIIIIGTISDKIETKNKQEVLIDIFENEGQVFEEEGLFDKVDQGYNPIAILSIPSIDFTQAVVEGVSNYSIKYYVGHFEDSAKPGEKGNFALAAHNTSNYSDAFKNIHKLKNGDIINIKTEDSEFIYQVNSNFIVEPDRVDVLDPTDDATITLITCTSGGKKRVVVKGVLIDDKNNGAKEDINE